MLLDLLGEYIYLAYCLLAMKYLWKKEITKKYWRFLVVVVVMAGIFFVESKIHMEGKMIYPIEATCILFLISGKKMIGLLQYLITDIVLSLLQRIIMFFLIAIGLSDYSIALNQGMGKIISCLCTLIALFLLRNKLKKYSGYLLELTWYHMLLFVVIGICLIYILAQAEVGMFYNGRVFANYIAMGIVLLISLFFLIIIAAFIIVDINRRHYQEESRLKDRYLGIQEKYYKMVVHKDNEARKINHDLKAHLGCLESLVIEEKYMEAKEYIRELKSNTTERIGSPFQSGNDIINAVLNDVAKSAEKHNTKILLKGSLPQNIKIKSPELCSLFYNLLSNSEEAMKDYQGSLPREIEVNISFYKRSIGITIKNPVMKKVDIDKLGKRYTSKNNKKLHGYGIENIKSIVDKYKGILEFKNDENYFIVKVIFVDIII